MREEKKFEISVLFYREESMWVALALEMNLRGYGPTRQEAMSDLQQMLAAQITFALQRGHPESVWCRAADEFWAMFENARRDQFVAEVSGEAPPDDRLADLVPLELIAAKHQSAWSSSLG